MLCSTMQPRIYEIVTFTKKSHLLPVLDIRVKGWFGRGKCIDDTPSRLRVMLLDRFEISDSPFAKAQKTRAAGFSRGRSTSVGWNTPSGDLARWSITRLRKKENKNHLVTESLVAEEKKTQPEINPTVTSAPGADLKVRSRILSGNGVSIDLPAGMCHDSQLLDAAKFLT